MWSIRGTVVLSDGVAEMAEGSNFVQGGTARNAMLYRPSNPIVVVYSKRLGG